MKIEKPEYKGQYRILGTINNRIGKADKVVGYVVINELNLDAKTLSIEQTRALMKQKKFSNAKILNDKIVNTECSMDKLYKYMLLESGQVICNDNRYTIIGQLMNNSNKVGYKLINCNRRVVYVNLSEIKKVLSSRYGLDSFCNASVKNSNGSYIVSAIKEPFTVINIIEKEKERVERVKTGTDEKKLYRLNNHLYQVINKYLHSISINTLRIEAYGIVGNMAMLNKDNQSLICSVPRGRKKASNNNEAVKWAIDDLKLIQSNLFKNNSILINKIQAIEKTGDNVTNAQINEVIIYAYGLLVAELTKNINNIDKWLLKHKFVENNNRNKLEKREHQLKVNIIAAGNTVANMFTVLKKYREFSEFSVNKNNLLGIQKATKIITEALKEEKAADLIKYMTSKEKILYTNVWRIEEYKDIINKKL